MTPTKRISIHLIEYLFTGSRMNTAKKKRHDAILELLTSNQITDQSYFVEELKKLGIETNQTVISRDLRELGVIKKAVGDRLYYSHPERDVNLQIARLAVKSITHNNAMIIIKVMGGLADHIADFIDVENIEVAGTIAGENTIFIAPKSLEQIDELTKKLLKTFKS